MAVVMQMWERRRRPWQTIGRGSQKLPVQFLRQRRLFWWSGYNKTIGLALYPHNRICIRTTTAPAPAPALILVL